MHDHDQWNSYWLKYRSYHQKKLRRLYAIFDFAKRDKNLKILDIGCGGGDFLHILAQNGFQAIQGWEPQAELVKQAGDRRISVGDCLNIGSHAREFDVVSMLGVMHHLHSFDEVQTCIANVYTLLKPGGIFCSYEQRRTIWRSLATILLLRLPIWLLPKRLQLDRRMVQAEKKELDLWLRHEKACTAECIKQGLHLQKEVNDPLYRYLIFKK